MVKGISRQVIVVKSPDPKLFEQAIFILRDSAVKEGVTEAMLMKQAKQAMKPEKHIKIGTSLLFMALGAVLAGAAAALIFLL